MDPISRELLNEINGAAKALDITPIYLCMKAVGNGHLPERLRKGQSVTMRTVERLRRWIAQQTELY